MIKKILLAGVFAFAMNSAAVAAPPASAEECQALVKSTFMSLAKKSMSADKTKEAEGLLDQLAGQCSEKKFSDAGKTAAALGAL